MNAAPAVRRLTAAEADRAGDVLARAFRDDPLNVFLQPDPRKRASRTRPLFQFFARFGIAGGQAYGAGDPLASVAVWSGPDSKRVGVGAALRAGAWRVAMSPLLLSAGRLWRLFGAWERMHRQYAPEPHVYLQTIGTLPEAQGRGYGAALLRAMLAEANAAGLPVYTETMTPDNVPLYEHFGFAVMEDYRVPNSDLHAWSLKRPAAAAR